MTTDAPTPIPGRATWPELHYADWKDTCETLHLYLQMVGKVKLALCPFLNQWWEVALSLSARGIASGMVPYGDRAFDIEFDLIDHRVVIRVSDGQRAELPLFSQPVAEFYRDFMATLSSLGIEVRISTMPSEIPGAIRFDHDMEHHVYNGEFARRWWEVAVATERVLNRFRSPFHGKSSAVNLWWGGFDLNYTRFNGEPVEVEPTLDPMHRYGENEGNFAVGFWPGGEGADAAFYAYMTPAPSGVENARIQPDGAQFVASMGEFFLPYETARTSESPEQAILTFFTSTYEACAALAGWDRAALEGDVPALPTHS